MQNEQASGLEKLNKNSTNWNSLCFFFLANYDYDYDYFTLDSYKLIDSKRNQTNQTFQCNTEIYQSTYRLCTRSD